MEVLGIDISGSSIKTALVDVNSGALKTEREVQKTPRPADSDALSKFLDSTLNRYDWNGPVGIGFPGVVLENVIKTAPNLSNSVIGLNLEQVLLESGVFEASAINEADAAGIAEMRFGSGRNRLGTVLMVTIGTGVGTALFYKGAVVPNMEFGHAEFKGREAESFLGNKARAPENFSWKQWSSDLNAYLTYLSQLVSAEAVILGGDIVNHREEFEETLSLHCPVKLAALGEDAGIIGAALAIDC